MRLLLSVALSLPFAVGQSARVEGTVVNDAGEGVAKAVVRLAEGDSMPIFRSASADRNGNFAFEDLSAGRYTLWIDRDIIPGLDDRMALTLTAGMDLKDLVLKLTTQGAISGKITDQDGDPVAGAFVTIMRFAYVRGHRQLRAERIEFSNDQGEYRIAKLAPGTYYLGAAQKRADVSELGRPAKEINFDTFFPSAPDTASATRLEVAAGTQLQGIDIRLRRVKVYTVKGKVTLAGSGDILAGSSLGLAPLNTDPLRGIPFGASGGAATIQPDGTFEFRNILPGTYVVIADTVRSANGEVIRFRPGPEVTVSALNVEGLTISLSRAAAITGAVIGEERDLLSLLNAKNPRIGIPLTPAEGLGSAPTVIRPQSDGTFRIAAGAVKYWWAVSGVGENVYVKSASLGEKDVTRALLDNSSGEGGVLRIVLSSGAVSVSGTAPQGTTVLIWPKTPDLGNMAGGMKSVLPDQDGGFRFTGLVPGEYCIAAFEGLEPGLAQSAEFLKLFNGDASKITLAEGGRAMVDAKLIPAEKVAAEIARLP